MLRFLPKYHLDSIMQIQGRSFFIFIVCVSMLCIAASHANRIEMTVIKTEVFTIPLEPSTFNWTYEGDRHQYVYEASFVGCPDLPLWIHYLFSERHHSGFLYGVVPNHTNEKISLDVVAWNKNTYETRTEQIDIIIKHKLNPAMYEIHIKIDNLNVADMFDSSRMEALFDIFTNHLWVEASKDLYVTFLESAIALGARRPLNPQQGDGVIIKLGSEMEFSAELLELQQEVVPLYSLQSCPRNFRKTSVERLFRDREFLVDWCKFQLVDIDKEQKLKQTQKIGNFEHAKMDETSDEWDSIMFGRDEMPERSYKKDLAVAIVLPLLIMTILVVLLSFIICVVHQDIMGLSKDFAGSAPIQEDADPDRAVTFKPRNFIRNLSEDREYSASPDILLPNRSPNSTMNRGVHCRPSPPPYVRPRYKPEVNNATLTENSGVEVIENDEGNACVYTNILKSINIGYYRQMESEIEFK
ncbi:alpha-sarcoglycan isoform X2 [Euwallacea fornicatus]|uniref:alpha-sarcoglycan isoform X2 n=1 Tax=Euwallacea fornicatus TaxID=995702 RepID=UPI0033906885